MPVQYSYTSIATVGRTTCADPQCLYSTAIPLLPPWAVRPVQTLSACKVQLYLYSPHGPYGLCRPSVPVQYSYTSTPPMGRTACTDPQCLHSTAITLLTLWAVRPVQSLSACTRVHFTFTFTLLDNFRGGLYKLSSFRRDNQIHVSAGSSSTVASQSSLLTD